MSFHNFSTYFNYFISFKSRHFYRKVIKFFSIILEDLKFDEFYKNIRKKFSTKDNPINLPTKKKCKQNRLCKIFKQLNHTI